MLELKDLSVELLEEWNKSTNTLQFIIKNDMNIVEYSENFPIDKGSFKNISDFLTHTHRTSFISNLNQCIKEKSVVSFTTNFSYDPTDVEDIPHSYKIIMQYIKDNKIMVVAEPISALTHENSKAYFSMVNDYSNQSRKLQKLEYHLHKKNEELKENMKELEYFANHDTLTSLYNRKRIFEELEKEYSKFKRLNNIFSIVMIDIDDFKNINDEYGHQSGDIVLSKLSSLMKSLSREYDSIGRFGGEEFLIIMPSSDLTSAITLTKRILKIVSETEIVLVNGEKIHIFFSAGVANSQKSISVDDLVAKADMRLYKSKENGKNQVT